MKKRLHFLSFFTLKLMLILSLLTPLIVHPLHAEDAAGIQTEYKYLDGLFNEKTLQEAHKIAEQIVKTYSSHKYHYVFVGRSLSLVKAILDVQGYSLTSLPLRGKQIDLTFSSVAGQNNRPLIWQHLNSHLPHEDILNGKRIVLLDYTASGAGLETAKKLVNWFYSGSKKLSTFEVTNFPIGFKNYIPGLGKSIRISSESMMYLHLLNSNFDRYAGHGTFNIESAQYLYYEKDTVENYLLLKRWLRYKKTMKASLRGSCGAYI